MTMLNEHQRTRVLPWANCLNSRDLGGYPTAVGGFTRWGQIVRSDNPARLTESACVAVQSYGIRTLIDLRRPDEVAAHPNPLLSCTSDLVYNNLSLFDPVGSNQAWRDEHPFVSLAQDYVETLELSSDRVADIVNTVALSPPGGVMINCMGGKDRTGLISALLLSLVGVSDEVVAADYALSRELLQPDEDDFVANGPGERTERERLVVSFAARDEVMLELLADLRNRHGGAEDYLREAGLSNRAVDMIRTRLVS